ncbi:LLM class flavin-dependent oxidoreductase [Bradyrhizobium sp. CB1650]|uniref:LLM class flavin-dependent oxidoreductase n=1 Tax=Bradyrhizobium sp. CB1650 TaxID=3039153 RepID=UPI0024347FE2|nr:LLM class flavin-dependent oxidoreductase [Bradyrhizobium sp. CB1650]WGD56768.1 LLM class flavin-dependent oxidoreductase [Bradyrhizobium sp. CB1650]
MQAGSSDAGVRFAAEFAEVVFTAQPSIESGKHYYANLKEKARQLGRQDDQVLVMPGIVPLLGEPSRRPQTSSKSCNPTQTPRF